MKRVGKACRQSLQNTWKIVQRLDDVKEVQRKECGMDGWAAQVYRCGGEEFGRCDQRLAVIG